MALSVRYIYKYLYGKKRYFVSHYLLMLMTDWTKVSEKDRTEFIIYVIYLSNMVEEYDIYLSDMS